MIEGGRNGVGKTCFIGYYYLSEFNLKKKNM